MDEVDLHAFRMTMDEAVEYYADAILAVRLTYIPARQLLLALIALVDKSKTEICP